MTRLEELTKSIEYDLKHIFKEKKLSFFDKGKIENRIDIIIMVNNGEIKLSALSMDMLENIDEYLSENLFKISLISDDISIYYDFIKQFENIDILYTVLYIGKITHT